MAEQPDCDIYACVVLLVVIEPGDIENLTYVQYEEVRRDEICLPVCCFYCCISSRLMQFYWQLNEKDFGQTLFHLLLTNRPTIRFWILRYFMTLVIS